MLSGLSAQRIKFFSSLAHFYICRDQKTWWSLLRLVTVTIKNIEFSNIFEPPHTKWNCYGSALRSMKKIALSKYLYLFPDCLKSCSYRDLFRFLTRNLLENSAAFYHHNHQSTKDRFLFSEHL